MKKPFIIGIIIAIAATAWFYSDTRTNNDEERPYELYQNGHYDDAIPELTKRAEKAMAKRNFSWAGLPSNKAMTQALWRGGTKLRRTAMRRPPTTLAIAI